MELKAAAGPAGELPVSSCFLFPGACLPEFSRLRVPDDHAISDLAMYNYIEVSEQHMGCGPGDHPCNGVLPRYPVRNPQVDREMAALAVLPWGPVRGHLNLSVCLLCAGNAQAGQALLPMVPA